MKQLYAVLVLAIGLLILNPSDGHAQKIGKWEKIGEQSISMNLDKDVIHCSSKRSFKTIKFHVQKAPVSFLKVYVKYANGSIDNLQFNELVHPGKDSGELDLRGSGRVIKEVIVYSKAEKKQPKSSSKKNAVIQVWGKH